MFLFKKIFSKFLFPLPLSFLVAFTGLYLLWFTKKQKAGKSLTSTGLLLIFLFSNNFAANLLLFPFENHFPKFEKHSNTHPSVVSNNSVKYVVVLGGGHTSDEDLPITSQLNEPVVVRLVEGIRLQRQYPDAKLILSGGVGGGHNPIPNAKLMAALAIQLGVDQNDIILEIESRDTKDEARLIKPLVEDAPFVLVTSASHMPRAMALFRKAGMSPIAVPTDHLIKNPYGISFDNLFPRSYHLQKSERAVYEALGLLWAKVRSQI